MKHEAMIIVISLCLVLGLILIIPNLQDISITGYAIHNESSGTDQNQTEEISKEIASLAIDESESIIKEMEEKDFSTLYMNDTLEKAKNIFEQAKYAEILRDSKSTEGAKQEARKALRLIDWRKITYGDVLVHTNNIKNRREQAFLLIDKISIEESKINPEKEGLFASPPTEVSEETKQILEDAKTAFREDKYKEAEELLTIFRNTLEE